MSDYTPNNNPYIPGDPYSYDLKWMVNDIKHMENRFAELDEQVEYATDKALMSEGFANGEQNGEAVDPDSPYYHNNSKYWKDEAAGEADRSRDEADRSDAEALVSEGYARGTQDGQAVTSGSPYYHNNSKYYSEESANSAQEAADYAAHIADPVSGIVTDWLNDNITQPTTPAIDTSLLVAGAAADAAATGLYAFGIRNSLKQKNLLDRSTENPGMAIDLNGDLYAASGITSSALIPVIYGHSYAMSMWKDAVNNNRHAFYDTNGDCVRVDDNIYNGFITIDDASITHIRIMYFTSEADKVVFAESILPASRGPVPYNKRTLPATDYVEAEADVIGDSNDQAYSLNDTAYNVLHMIAFKNLRDPDDPDVVHGSFISGMSGGSPVWTTLSGWNESGFIPVTPGDRCLIVLPTGVISDATMCAVFDANKDIIATGYFWDAILKCQIMPAGAAYFRMAYPDNSDRRFVKIPKGYALPINSLPVDQILPFGVSDVSIPYLYNNLKPLTENVPGAQWNNKKWYGYGTSLTDTGTFGKYPTYLAAMSGLQFTNKGIGGGGIGDLGAYSRGQVYSAICNITDGKLDADLITLETGANDVAIGINIGDIYDTGRSSLCGCLNDCIRYLQTNTSAQIVIFASMASLGGTDEWFELYSDWIAKIEQICKINRVHFINTNSNMGVAKLASSDGSLYVVDNIHQTDLGGYITAQDIWYQLRNIPCFYTSMP